MIQIITDNPSERLKYVIHFIFNEILNDEYVFMDEFQKKDEKLPAVFYTKNKYESELYYHNSGILSGISIDQITLHKTSLIIDDILKKMESSSLQGVDIFAPVFICLSRYEEYLPHQRDKYGRYQAKDSIAFKKGILDRAFVDEIILFLKAGIEKSYPKYKFSKSKGYNFSSTIDIDQAWAFAHKGIRNIGGAIKDITSFNFQNIKRRLNAFLNPKNDPFFTYPFISDLHTELNINPAYFILLGEKTSALDKNQNPDNPHFKKLIRSLSKKYTLGIHPSSMSNNNPEILSKEIKILSETISKPVTSSRQHFLIMELPLTYHQLLKAGITADHSMGYPEQSGYRASTGHSFFWYDLKNEKATNLKIFPFQLMDVTLKNYMKLTPDAAIDLSERLLIYAKKLHSPVCLIWHNSSLDESGDWKDWTKVYKTILKSGKME